MPLRPLADKNDNMLKRNDLKDLSVVTTERRS
jgi:hypothetical protein